MWSSLFSEVMPRKIKGDAPKKSLWSSPLSPQIPCLSLPLPHAHLTSELTPSFIQFLSRCIYILRCRAMAASHFICAGLLGSSLLSCFGLCVVSKMQRVKCKPRGHIRVTRVNPARSTPLYLCDYQWEYFKGCADARAPCTWPHACMHVSARMSGEFQLSALVQSKPLHQC